MSDNSRIMRERQCAVRRELDRRNIAMKVVSFDSGIPYSTLLTYFPADTLKQPAEIPGGALFALHGAIPDDLLNLLHPDGWAVVRVPEGIDFDDISSACRDFIDAKEKAHHPESECGRDIGPNEHSELGTKIVQFRGRVA